MTIEYTVAEFFELDPSDVLSINRKDELVKARHVTWYFLNLYGERFEDISTRYGVGGTGVRSGVGKARKAIINSHTYRNTISAIQAVIETKVLNIV